MEVSESETSWILSLHVPSLVLGLQHHTSAIENATRMMSIHLPVCRFVGGL